MLLLSQRDSNPAQAAQIAIVSGYYVHTTFFARQRQPAG